MLVIQFVIDNLMGGLYLLSECQVFVLKNEAHATILELCSGGGLSLLVTGE